MKRFSSSIVFGIATFIIGLIGVGGWLWLREGPPEVVSVSQYDSIIFSDKDLDRVVAIAQLPKLREVSTRAGDIEIRVWRGDFLGSTEALFIRKISGAWSAEHVAVGMVAGDLTVQLEDLAAPKSGWEYFEQKVVDDGLLRLPSSPEVRCPTGYDPVVYVVEINQENTYRNYQYAMGVDTCRETRQMNDIGDMIATEFGFGRYECTSSEWACRVSSNRPEQLVR